MIVRWHLYGRRVFDIRAITAGGLLAIAAVVLGILLPISGTQWFKLAVWCLFIYEFVIVPLVDFIEEQHQQEREYHPMPEGRGPRSGRI